MINIIRNRRKALNLRKMGVEAYFRKCFGSRTDGFQLLNRVLFVEKTLTMPRIPEIISARSRVRLIRADDQTPSWKKDIGRQFRVGYYNWKHDLDCIWLVNEGGEY